MAEQPLDAVGHPHQLRLAVAGWQRDEDRLGEATAEDLDLVTIDERADARDGRWLFGLHPVEQRPRVVEPGAEAGSFLERADERLVGVLPEVAEDPAEVAHRLVVVEDEAERDSGSHGPSIAGIGWRS